MTVAEHSLSQRNLCKKEEIQFEMEFRTFGLYLNYVLLSCLIGISSGVKPELTILDDLLDLTCGSRTLLTCKLHLQPAPTMSWNIGTNELTECTVTDCLPLAPQLDNYNASVDASTGKTYYLEIYPVRLDDSRQFTCSDGEVSDVIATSINALKIVKDEFSTYMKVEDNIVVYSRTSNCVEKANEMEHILKISKPNTNSFETYSVENTTEIIQCTDAENPNCGGKGTNKANFTITIQTDQVGDLYEFRLEVNYLGETISFQDIGSYNITKQCSDDQIICDNVCMVKCDCPVYKNTTECKGPWCAKLDYECIAWILGILAGICLVIVCITLIKVFYDKSRNKINEERAKSENQPTDAESMKNSDQSPPIELRDSRYRSHNH